MTTANPYRGEASLDVAGEKLVLRPSFGALVKAEAELGSLIALIERASVWECSTVGGRIGVGPRLRSPSTGCRPSITLQP